MLQVMHIWLRMPRRLSSANLSLQNTTSLLITQNPTYARRKLTTDTIQVPGRFDGINFNYQIMTIFDLIRVMYYQKYIEKQG